MKRQTIIIVDDPTQIKAETRALAARGEIRGSSREYAV